MSWPQGATGWVDVRQYPEPAARLYFWDNYQAVIMSELVKWLDQGWQPIGEIGPSCVQLRTYKTVEGTGLVLWLAQIMIVMGTFGMYLLFIRDWHSQMIGFKVSLRRRKG